MRPVKSVFGAIGMLLPVLYCGGLVYYFTGFRGLPDASLMQGLGPTVLGLSAIGLLFCVPVGWKLVKMLTGPRAPAPDRPGGEAEEAGSGFDADAALARYMARKAAGAEGVVAPAAAYRAEPVVSRPSFGRKTG